MGTIVHSLTIDLLSLDMIFVTMNSGGSVPGSNPLRLRSLYSYTHVHM